jgi:GxxExxY protein
MNANAPMLDALSNRIIGCALAVSNTLGCGFLEKVYEKCARMRLGKAGLTIAQQYGITVSYSGMRSVDFLLISWSRMRSWLN